jgi:hypothetical protein
VREALVDLVQVEPALGQRLPQDRGDGLAVGVARAHRSRGVGHAC